MPFVSLHEYFPKVAVQETRSLTVLETSRFDLPAGVYSFVEMYCDEPGCDCRRVFFSVVSAEHNRLEAVIAYGWENPEFYAKLLMDDDPNIIAELKGPSLNRGSPQSEHAPALLELTRNVLLQDSAYVERIKRHYNMFRDKIDSMTVKSIKKKKRKKKMRTKEYN